MRVLFSACSSLIITCTASVCVISVAITTHTVKAAGSVVAAGPFVTRIVLTFVYVQFASVSSPTRDTVTRATDMVTGRCAGFVTVAAWQAILAIREFWTFCKQQDLYKHSSYVKSGLFVNSKSSCTNSQISFPWAHVPSVTSCIQNYVFV